jgi:hypothetical protein
MATSISGSVSLSYGAHNHSESFSTTTAALTHANPTQQYAAGGGRAVYHGSYGAALEADLLGSDDEGLLLIKNINTVGDLFLSVDTGSNWDIKIPAGVANLISVGPDHPIHLKTNVAQQTGFNVASVTSAGVITFDGTVATAGTYVMKATANPDNASGPSFIMKTTTDASLTGTVYELDGVTKKDLAGVGGYGTATQVTLDNIVDYRYTLTEA